MSTKGSGGIPGEVALKWLGGFGLNPAVVLSVLGLLLAVFTIYFIGIPLNRWVGFMLLLLPVFLPYVLFHKFVHLWLEYVQLDFDLNAGRTTLEIQFPQEVFKSPLAMELVLTQLYQTANPDNHIQTYWDGKHPPIFGLEIISDGGRVRFFISTPIKKFKNIVESQLYAQYPGIIVTELHTDYTAIAPWDPKRFECFSVHYRLKKPDPYPIKTYIDFGLDKDPKEEFKIDPITPMLELLGSIGPKEQIWIQLLISANCKSEFKNGFLHASPDWKDSVRAEINTMAQRDPDKKTGAFESDSAPRVTPGERDIITSLERSLSKFAFNTKLRTMYIAETNSFLPGERIGAFISIWQAFSDTTRNEIGAAWRTDFDWNWWQDPSGKKRKALKKSELMYYKKRMYEQRNSLDGGFILTTEELATIFHPTGKVVLTPSLERIPSARAEAPANLPRAN